MEALTREQRRRLDLANKPTDQARFVVQWLGGRGVLIVEPSDRRAKDAELNPNIILLSERQLMRRIDEWFRPPE